MESPSKVPARDAGEELLRHAQWLRRLARSLVVDPERADELVQDAWVAALRRPPESRALRPWLRSVVRNAAWQGFRRRGRREEREPMAGTVERADERASPDDVAERLETERRLTDELARLEEPFRTTLVLRYYDGLEPTEIARRDGLPAGTVRWRVKRGLELLRERLDQRFGERGAWCALLLPLAGGRELTAAGLATGAAAVQGALAMNALTKLGVGVAGVAALALTLGVGGVLPESVWPFRNETTAPLAVRPYTPPPAEEEEEEEADLERAASSERVAAGEASSGSTAEPAPAASAPRTVVEARAVDGNGAALPGAFLRELTGDSSPRAARLAVHGGANTVRSAGDGLLELELESMDEPFSAEFELGARGFASVGLEAVVRPAERVSLGAHVLLPAGAVSGRVTDPSGLPLEGVRIRAGEADVPRRELDAQRLHPDIARVPSTVTARDGHFTLDRLPPGRARIWASAKGCLAAYSAPIEVSAGEEAHGLELVLAPLPPENHVLVLVVDPAGAPFPHALLEFRHSSRSTGTSVAGNVTADADGRHEFVVPEDARLAVTALDPVGVHGPASAADLRPGAGTTLLRLGAPAPLALRVRDLDGAPVERFGYSLVSADGELEHQRAPRSDHAGGLAEARLPGGEFVLRVDAPGHELAQLGPFSPRAVADLIEVVLAPVPGVHGRVLANGRPVEGARVRLHPRVEPRVRFEKDGFVSLWRSDVTDEVESDADGRFVLTVREAGEYAARAEKPGHAPAVSEVLRIGAGLSAPELALELTEGGAIEGRVIAARGADPAGTIVGLSRGDGYDRTLRVGVDGAYRFERLTPGQWLLVAMEEEIVPERTSTTTSDARGPVELDWTCTVRAGETSTCDLVLQDAEACVLHGLLSIDAAPPGPRQAWLVPEGTLFESEPRVRAGLDPEGRFRLTAAEPGRYQLAIADSLDGPGMQLVLDVVDLRAGEQRWEQALETGTLVLAQAPAWNGEDIPGAAHIWEGPGELRTLTVLASEAEGELRVAVPAGPGRVVRPEREEHDLTRWPTLLELDVPRGGELRAELP